MNDLEELKSLLFGAEKQTLDSLSERVQQPETRAADIADVLPEAVRLSHRGGDALVTELRDPVTKCLKQSFEESPQEYADVLYPIMGPAIRKSISHALKAFAQQINQTMEYSLSAKGLKWRLQAWRSGIPFSDFVMQRTLQYRVEQAYLISRENGLLMAHVHHDASRIKDSDAVSAMFTAIQDFVKESFSPDRSGRLETADMGEFTLWAVHGPHALMVCVIRGVPPRALRSELSAILERIHFRYGDAVRSYSGDTASVENVEEELNDCLRFQAQQAAADKSSGISKPLIAAGLIIIGVLSYFAFGRWQHEQQFDRLADVVAATPGIYVGDISYADEKFTLHGLRDPLAMSVDKIAAGAELDSQQVESNMRPYQSLDPEILYLRATAVLDPPDGVSLVVSNGRLDVSGRAPQRWIDALRVKTDADTIGMPILTDNLESLDWIQLESSVADVAEARFVFSSGDTLIDDDAIRLRQFAARIKGLTDEAMRLGAKITVSIVGSTDNSGSAEVNSVLSRIRADVARQTLVAAGVEDAQITIGENYSTDIAGEQTASQRNVSLRVALSRE